MQEGATKYNVVYVKILHHPQRSSVVQNAFKCLNIKDEKLDPFQIILRGLVKKIFSVRGLVD